MKLQILQENLRKGLAVVSRAVATKSTLPVLSNVLLSTDDGRLRLSATNLEIGITTWAGAKVETDGAVTLPAKLLSDVVASLPNQPIGMELDEQQQAVTLTCGKFKTVIKGIEADEFPIIPSITGATQVVKLSAETIRAIGDRVAIAALDDNTRPVLQGVWMHIQGNGATFAATDSYRLARMYATVSGAVDAFEVIIPARAMIEMARIVSDEEVQIAISPSASHVMFKCGESVELVSRLIDGQYPAIERVIPDSMTTRAILDTAELQKAVRLAGLFYEGDTKKTRVELTNDQFAITANTAQTGNNEGAIDAVVSGENIGMWVDARYLADALASLKTPQAAIEILSDRHPMLIKPVGSDEYLHLIMPMNTR